MSTGRLTFLYPHLVRSAARPLGTTAKRTKGSFAPRHGKAVEPAAWEERQKQKEQQQQQQQRRRPQLSPSSSLSSSSSSSSSPQPPPPPQSKQSNAIRTRTAEPDRVSAGEPLPARQDEAPGLPPAPKQAPRPKPTLLPALPEKLGRAPSAATENGRFNRDGSSERLRPTGSQPRDSSPLEAVLLTQPPERESAQHPSMSPPPYVHHFDSYSLVKQLQEGGYSQEQATTAMKAIRTLLAQNLDVAQQSLVSKSDVENETYLFTAACSELSAEIKNNRRLRDEQMRQQRTHLQHEVDILTQSLNQELLTLTDNVRGMFNDRKMTVREEHKAVESAIQKINYKMSILLSSDCKSEIEGVRWILIRRSVLGIIFMAILTLGMLRYATYLGQKRKLEAEKKKKEREELRRDGGKTDHSAAADAAAILAAN
ncbi:hypothetical protein CDD83_4498 [Cordyceps sp. RAO-2017]|nr:hypothetical protein CDD83_4498 [Cordyceps sp. RAO-2017]